MSRRFLHSLLQAALVIYTASSLLAQQGPSPAEAASNSTSAPSTTSTAVPPAGMQPPPAQSPGSERSSYSSIHVDGPYIALTFDDGPRPNEKGKSGNEIGFTPKLLDILKERHIHATFFVLGNMVQSHPEILRREAADGHEIGNHSWSHLPLTKVVQREGGLHHELADTSELITQTIGKPVTLMRPPYGATNPRLSKAIEREYGMKVILWSVDPDDWKDPGASVVSSRILNGWKQSGGTKPGAIILTHDIHKGTIEAMPAMLDALLAKGYKFVTVSELLAMESKNPIPSPTPSAQQASKSKQNQS